MKPVVFHLSPADAELAAKIAAITDATVRHVQKGARDAIASAFKDGEPVIAICASGILIRAIGPHLGDKQTDSPVVAVSPDGAHIVPLVGGHHGANHLARQIASALAGVPAITTASDTQFGLALDEPPDGLMLANPEDMKPFVSRALAGEKICLNGSHPWLITADLPFADEGTLTITITTEPKTGGPDHLIFHPQTLCLGVGCERGISAQELAELVQDTLASANISPHAIAGVGSLDLKSDEAAIHALAAQLNAHARFFAANDLAAEEPRLATPSEAVRKEVGVAGVAEAAALALAGPQGTLTIQKTRSKRATCALATAPRPLAPAALAGRPQGHLAIVGIGPGDRAMRSPVATEALTSARHWVGYGLYLDLITDLASDHQQHRFDLGKEEARVRHAIALAAGGERVALVCSGDAAIYAMAALVYEVLDKGNLTPAEQRIAVETIPGISAFQLASARAGALIGHDFCTISLSDLLTPWATIEARIKAAAEGDFNIAFYNPRSRQRADHLARAIELLKPLRTPQTPVIVASNLARPDEAVTVTTLETFDPETVDMLTIVLVGSSQSRTLERGDGRTWCYTPRGYANKKPDEETQ